MQLLDEVWELLGEMAGVVDINEQRVKYQDRIRSYKVLDLRR